MHHRGGVETIRGMEGSRGVSFFGQRRTLHIVLSVITFGLWLLVLLAVYLWRRGRRGWAIATASVVGLLVLLIAIGSATSPESDTSATATTEETTTEGTTTESVVTDDAADTGGPPRDPTMDKRTSQYIAQVQTCQVTVGLTLLMIKRGETDPFKLSDSANTAAETCETIKTNLAVADTDHFDDQALLAWSGVSDMKSGMNALRTYIDNPTPSKLIEARDKIQRGDAQAAQGIRQINRRRVVYGLKKIQT
jgi:hypothetical protein